MNFRQIIQAKGDARRTCSLVWAASFAIACRQFIFNGEGKKLQEIHSLFIKTVDDLLITSWSWDKTQTSWGQHSKLIIEIMSHYFVMHEAVVNNNIKTILTKQGSEKALTFFLEPHNRWKRK